MNWGIEIRKVISSNFISQTEQFLEAFSKVGFYLLSLYTLLAFGLSNRGVFPIFSSGAHPLPETKLPAASSYLGALLSSWGAFFKPCDEESQSGFKEMATQLCFLGSPGLSLTT